MKCIRIGDAKTLNCEGWQLTPDDRQERIEIVGGIVVQDHGLIDEGEIISCSCNLSAAEADKVFTYWKNRQKVDIVDESGNIHQNRRVIVKRYKYVDMFPNFYNIDFEFWRL